ncbi:hypothetical protein Q3V94_00440 [Caloramator sp. CAR-1]|uniref:hypothetical protein n=1 Tax=Caloramator sp. CAR-1 TaxID=3062777 RepID=UPI0026E34A68|nr:hypothetical protein [Caloramator sp. CAR-1]MDO6353551.1 hypothetical protein [Caloramator sp. CAR-1]
MRGGYRVDKRIKADLMDIRQVLSIVEELITDKYALMRVRAAKKIIDKYIEGGGYNEK